MGQVGPWWYSWWGHGMGLNWGGVYRSSNHTRSKRTNKAYRYVARGRQAGKARKKAGNWECLGLKPLSKPKGTQEGKAHTLGTR